MSGIKQQAISRLENPSYGKATLTTLKKIAAVHDVGLLVEFVPFTQLINRVSGTPYIEYGFSPATMNIPSFDEELAQEEKPTVMASAQVERSTQMMDRFAESHLDQENIGKTILLYFCAHGATPVFDNRLEQHGIGAEVNFDLPDEQGTEPSLPFRPSPGISGPEMVKNRLQQGGH